MVTEIEPIIKCSLVSCGNCGGVFVKDKCVHKKKEYIGLDGKPKIYIEEWKCPICKEILTYPEGGEW